MNQPTLENLVNRLKLDKEKAGTIKFYKEMY